MSDIISPIMDIVGPYLSSVKRSGLQNAVACCPFHKDSKPSFAINTENGLWVCYACGAKGNLRTFLQNVGKSDATIEATLAPIAEAIKHHKNAHEIKESIRYRTDRFLGVYILPEAVLGLFDYMPIGLVNIGFDQELLKDYGVGYDIHQDRIIFPIRDLYGNLVGVAGRATRKGDEPRYKVYKAGYRTSTKKIVGDFGEGFDNVHSNYDIRKSDHLWNAHRVYKEAMTSNRTIVVVEGFKACLWMIQNGFDNTVALMGSSASKNQLDILTRMGGNRIVLFLDNDTAGIEGTKKLYQSLSFSVTNVFIAAYPEWAAEPDDMRVRALNSAVKNARRWREHVQR